MMNFNQILKIISKVDISMNDEKMIIDFFKDNIHQEDIINKIVHINEPYIYSLLIHIIEFDIDVSIVEEKRCHYIKKIIKNNQKVKELSDQNLKENIIYYFFHDNFYNFLINYGQMLLYIKRCEKDLVDLKHLVLYDEFRKIDNMSRKEKIDLFNRYSDYDNIFEMFYDDIRIVKDHSYQTLIHNLLKLDKSLDIYNKNLSKEYGIDIYYLNGENFYSFVRYFSLDNNNYNCDYHQKKYYSFSYIGNQNIGTIGYLDYKGLILMYSNIDYQKIVHVHHTDSSSSSLKTKDNFISKKTNEIHTAKSLINNTDCYNEIVVKSDEKGILPSAVICFDKIRNEELAFSKKHHLPILLINSKKYYYSENFPDFSDNTYTYLV